MVTGKTSRLAQAPNPVATTSTSQTSGTTTSTSPHSRWCDSRSPVTPPTPGAEIKIQNIEIFAFRYPNQTHDAETLLIDPVDGRPYILTKESKPSTTAYLYGYPMPLDPSNIKTLTLDRTFSHPAPRFSGGDVSSDGRWIVVRNNDDVFTYLRGVPTSGFGAGFVNIFCQFSADKQGNAESITISADGTKLWCVSEARRRTDLGIDGSAARGHGGHASVVGFRIGVAQLALWPQRVSLWIPFRPSGGW